MHGERGSGTPPIMLTDVSLTPEKVVGGYSFVSIGEALEWHTCAIATKQADPGKQTIQQAGHVAAKASLIGQGCVALHHESNANASMQCSSAAMPCSNAAMHCLAMCDVLK